MHAAFVDANPALRAIAERLGPHPPGSDAFVRPSRHPAGRATGGAGRRRGSRSSTTPPFRSRSPAAVPASTDVVFLGTGARSYMDPEALAGIGIAVHIIKGSTRRHRGRRVRDRPAVRRRARLRRDGPRHARRPVAAHRRVAARRQDARPGRLRRHRRRDRAHGRGLGMKVLAGNRTPRSHPGVEFVPIERLLAESHAVSLHLLLNDETRGFLSRRRIATMPPRRPAGEHRPRGPGRRGGDDRGAAARASSATPALDVFELEPLPAGHVLTTLAERHPLGPLRLSHPRGKPSGWSRRRSSTAGASPPAAGGLEVPAICRAWEPSAGL